MVSTPRFQLANLDPNRPIHLAGIGGSAMRGLAKILHQRGFCVTGTDLSLAEVDRELGALGIPLSSCQDGSQIPPRAQLIIATAALTTDHPELVAARRRDIPVIKYADALGALLANTRGAAIAGTHGKTTTTAMIATMLRRLGVDAGFMIGGFVPDLDGNASSGTADIFVAEACEYDRSFLKLRPTIAVITNIEADHLDMYRDLDDIREAFRDFAGQVPEHGAVIYAADCPNTTPILSDLHCATPSFGIHKPADYTAADLRFDTSGSYFELVHRQERIGEVRLGLPGLHNVANALAALAVCHRLGFELADAAAALARFHGVDRRFQIRPEVGGITIVDDYAHHPTELCALLEAAGHRFPGRRLVILFQPHQLSRTRHLIDQFASAFSGADLAILTDIYLARDHHPSPEDPDAAVLVDRIRASGTEARYIGSLDATIAALPSLLSANDVLLVVGAGDIFKVSDALLLHLKEDLH